MSGPRGYTSRDTASLRRDGSKLVSNELDGTTTVDILKLGVAASKISFQTSGDLACTVEVSLNGTNWISAGAATAAAILSYSDHNVVAIRATRTGGSGRLHVAAS